jgi:hypothetical protein
MHADTDTSQPNLPGLPPFLGLNFLREAVCHVKDTPELRCEMCHYENRQAIGHRFLPRQDQLQNENEIRNFQVSDTLLLLDLE